VLYHHRTQAKGAEGNHIRGVISALSEIGCEIEVAAPPGVDMNTLPKHAAVDSKKGIFPSIAARAPQIFFEIVEMLYNFYALPKLWKMFNKKTHDFIYERYALFCYAGAMISRIFQVPFFLEVNDATVIERSRPLILKPIAKAVERWVLKRASVVYTITDHFKSLLIEAHNIPEAKIHVTPNAVDPARFQKIDGSITRRRLGIRSETVLASTGAFVHWHGLDFLVESTRELLATENMHILLVGDGPVRQGIESLAKRYGVNDRITFTGFVSSEMVPSYLALADIFVIPDSNRHCSPVKLFEYMAMGKPIVAPAYDPIKAIIADGFDGVLFRPKDAADFQRSLTRILHDPAFAASLGNAAEKKVYGNHTWNHNARIIMRDYQHVTGILSTE
jgi:glycosyltransferase involved in cell wall biosynthesis